MASLTDARVRRMARDIAADLRRTTWAEAFVEDFEPAVWRHAARLAGRDLGWRVRTGVLYGVKVWAKAIDFREPAWYLEAGERQHRKFVDTLDVTRSSP